MGGVSAVATGREVFAGTGDKAAVASGNEAALLAAVGKPSESLISGEMNAHKIAPPTSASINNSHQIRLLRCAGISAGISTGEDDSAGGGTGVGSEGTAEEVCGTGGRGGVVFFGVVTGVDGGISSLQTMQILVPGRFGWPFRQYTGSIFHLPPLRRGPTILWPTGFFRYLSVDFETQQHAAEADFISILQGVGNAQGDLLLVDEGIVDRI